jgi:hypothetical protein
MAYKLKSGGRVLIALVVGFTAIHCGVSSRESMVYIKEGDPYFHMKGCATLGTGGAAYERSSVLAQGYAPCPRCCHGEEADAAISPSDSPFLPRELSEEEATRLAQKGTYPGGSVELKKVSSQTVFTFSDAELEKGPDKIHSAFLDAVFELPKRLHGKLVESDEERFATVRECVEALGSDGLSLVFYNKEGMPTHVWPRESTISPQGDVIVPIHGESRVILDR